MAKNIVIYNKLRFNLIKVGEGLINDYISLWVIIFVRRNVYFIDANTKLCFLIKIKYLAIFTKKCGSFFNIFIKNAKIKFLYL